MSRSTSIPKIEVIGHTDRKTAPILLPRPLTREVKIICEGFSSNVLDTVDEIASGNSIGHLSTSPELGVGRWVGFCGNSMGNITGALRCLTRGPCRCRGLNCITWSFTWGGCCVFLWRHTWKTITIVFSRLPTLAISILHFKQRCSCVFQGCNKLSICTL